MARGWYEKVLSVLGYSDQEDEYEAFEEYDEDDQKGRKRAPVLSLHTSPEVKIIVLTPTAFDEAEKAANHLKSRKPVVLNFNRTTKEVAQRILDFLSGTVFALNGSMQRVSKETFLFVPNNITVYSEVPGGNMQDRLMLKLDREGVND